MSSTRASGVRATLIRWKPSKTTSRSHREQRSSEAEQQQVGWDIVEVLEDRGGRSPLIIKDLDLYPQPPTNTRSPTLNSEEPPYQIGKIERHAPEKWQATQQHAERTRSSPICVPRGRITVDMMLVFGAGSCLKGGM